MSRRTLITVVSALGIGLVSSLLYVFVSSLWPSDRARSLGYAEVDVSLADPGTLRTFRSGNGPIFVFRPTEQTWTDLRNFDAEVQDRRITNYYPKLGVFIYYGYSPYLGCELKHAPKDDPVALNLNPNWPGGYRDSCQGLRYDYAGRAVNLGMAYPPFLKGVRISRIDGSRVEVDMFRGS